MAQPSFTDNASALGSPFEPEQGSTGLHTFVDPADVTSTPPTSGCSSSLSTSGAYPHISTGLDSNGHLIRRLYLHNTHSVRTFDHPNVSQLTDLTCILLPSRYDFEDVENILSRNINHQLQRLKLGRSVGRQRSRNHSYSRDVTSRASRGRFQDPSHNGGRSRTLWSDARSSVHHFRPTREIRHRSRISRSSQESSSSRRTSHSRDIYIGPRHPINRHGHAQGNPHGPSSQHIDTSFTNASEQDMETDDPDERESSQPSSHDVGTSAIMNSLLRGIRSQGTEPSHLTHLSLLQYEFVMQDWIQMMHMVPALQELDLDIISVFRVGAIHSSRINRGTSALKSIGRNDDHHRHRQRSLHFRYIQRGIYSPLRQLNSTPNMKDAYSNHTTPELHDGSIPNTSSLESEGCPMNNVCLQFEQHSLDENHDDIPKVTLSSNPQFPSIRSLIFRGSIVLPDLLAYLPNLERLALEDPPYESLLDPHANTETATPGPTELPSPILDLANVISAKCPRLCRLVLTESSALSIPQWSRQTPQLIRAIPRLLHFETSLRLVSQNQEILEALLQHHEAHLQSLVIRNGTDSSDSHGTSYHPHHHYQQQPPMWPHQQDTFLDSDHPHPTGQPQDWQQTLLPQLCLRVLETCSGLRVYDSKVPLLIKDVMTSIPSWSCRFNIAVLRLELQELTGAGMLAGEEEEVMEMFVKTLFLGTRSSSAPSSAPTSSSSSSTRRPGTGLDRSFSELSGRSSSTNATSSTATSTPPSSASSSSSSTAEVALASGCESSHGTSHSNHLSQQQDPMMHSMGTFQQSAVGSFLSSFDNCQIQAAGRLMALQYLVEHQLTTMPNLDRFFLGSKMFKIPSRPG
ncbi:hypothetical protein B0O80DRAFT_127841 [Mortierella sp. GBAus27b]|nr:hypothetical protein B0O80DRAFT_127841 [Mortierella sp. GBAus27b]